MRKQKRPVAKRSHKPQGEWSGPFDGGMDRSAAAYTTSLPVDRRLFREDIAGTMAHAEMLGATKLITARELKAILAGLREIERECEDGTIFARAGVTAGERYVADDIHMLIEYRLIQKIGAAGRRVHTGRSRNDQIALDERLYLRKHADSMAVLLVNLQRSLLAKAVEVGGLVVPGYTHLQQAQPILHAHHLLAYVEMFERDRERFADCRKRINRSPLGAAAFAGTSLPVDRRRTASRLGFDGLLANSIDAVSDRDVLIEFLAAGAITMMHLSRLAEELVVWSTAEWGFAVIGDGFASGSSIMPQKKNPDTAELLRGKTGRVYGNLMALLTVMKGLPLAYNRDMQEDKEPLFDTVDTLEQSLDIAARMIGSTTFRKRTAASVPGAGMMVATDLAEYLVARGVPFREAHTIVGSIVRDASKMGQRISDLSLARLRTYSTQFSRDVLGRLDIEASPGLKRTSGSTSPREVAAAIRRWQRKLGPGS